MDEKRLNSKKMIIISGLLAIILIGSAVFVLGKTIWSEKRSDEQIVMDSLVQTTFMESAEKVITINIDELKLAQEVDDIQTELILSMVEDLELEFTLRQNEASEEAEILFALNMRSVNLLNGQLYLNNELIGIDIPLIFDQPLYMTWEDIATKHELNADEKKTEMKEVRKNLLGKNYEAIEQFDASAYEAMFKAFIAEIISSEVVQEKIILAKEKTEVDTYTMNTDLEELMTFINSILFKLEEEQKVSEKMTDGKELKLDIDMIKQYVNGEIVSRTSIQDDLILKSDSVITGTIDGLLDTTIDAALVIEYILGKQKDIEFDKLDMKRAINVSALSEMEKKALKLEIKDTLIENMNENQLLSVLGEYIDIESLFEE